MRNSILAISKLVFSGKCAICSTEFSSDPVVDVLLRENIIAAVSGEYVVQGQSGREYTVCKNCGELLKKLFVFPDRLKRLKGATVAKYAQE